MYWKFYYLGCIWSANYVHAYILQLPVTRLFRHLKRIHAGKASLPTVEVDKFDRCKSLGEIWFILWCKRPLWKRVVLKQFDSNDTLIAILEDSCKKLVLKIRREKSRLFADQLMASEFVLIFTAYYFVEKVIEGFL